MPKLAKNAQNLPLLDQKNPKFWIFPQTPLLIHARRHLGEHFRKFSTKNNQTKFEVMLQKQQKCKKIDYMVRAGRPISWPKTPILNFLMSRSSHIPFKNLEVDFRKFWAKTNDQNWSYTPKSVKIYQNQLKMAKISPFRTKKAPNFEFFHRYHYSYTLEDT